MPKTPNAVLWLQYTPENTIWVSMGGYDAGYIYEISFKNDAEVRSTPIPGAEDVEITSYLYVYEILYILLKTDG